MKSSTSSEQAMGKFGARAATVKGLLQMTYNGVVTALALFLPAGRLDWGMGWGFLCLSMLTQGIAAFTLTRSNPELLAERAESFKHRQRAKPWDRPLAGIISLFGPTAIYIVSGLDVRHGWGPEIPLAVQLAGLLIALLASLLGVWAMISNKFFYGFVYIREDRGHAVASDGPYRYLRHPAYLGSVASAVAVPVALGSLWALIPGVTTVCAAVLRTALEDSTLKAELGGYTDYAQRVRYRLVPGIW